MHESIAHPRQQTSDSQSKVKDEISVTTSARISRDRRNPGGFLGFGLWVLGLRVRDPLVSNRP